MSDLLNPNRRILLVDDNPAIHEDFRRVLLRDDSAMRDLDADAAALFGGETEAEPELEAPFELDSADQGEAALGMVRDACAAGNPYAMAFVDMRMPPGWDGLRTIEELWKVDSDLQVVICTAYSDRSWSEIQRTLTARDRWMVVKKPFDQIEVLQLAHALTNKWDMTRMADLRQNALEQMVAARTEQLAAALQTNTDFLNNVSHEMLTPMNGVLGMLQLLADTSLDEEQKELTETAASSAEHLLRLLRQVLAYNEAGSDEVEPVTSSVNLQEWVSSVAEKHVRRKALEKGLGLKIDIDQRFSPAVRLPTNVLGKVMELLLDNAVKFTRTGEIKVEILPDETKDRAIRFSILDTGAGLTNEQLEMLDIPFTQIDSSNTRASEGIGIGLPLARRLLGLIGSDLKIESVPGEGTRASFAIVAAADAAAA